MKMKKKKKQKMKTDKNEEDRRFLAKITLLMS